MGTVEKKRNPVIRGLAALFIFVFTVLVTEVVGLAISITILYNILEYNAFPSWGGNQPPDWLSATLFWGTHATALTLALFLGWKFWNHRR